MYFLYLSLQDNDNYTALMLAVGKGKEEKDLEKQQDYVTIARRLWNHPNIDKGKMRNGKTVDKMVKNKKRHI